MPVKSFLASVVCVQNVRFGVRSFDTGRLAKVLKSLTFVSASQQNGVLARRRKLGQLIESEDFASSLDDSSASLLGHAERADFQFGDLQ